MKRNLPYILGTVALVSAASYFMLRPVPLAAATTYHVATTGTPADGASCSTATMWSVATPANAKTTVNGGLSCLVSGDTLVIHAGTYAEKIDNDAGSNIPNGGGTDATRTVIKNFPGDIVTLKPPICTNCRANGLSNRRWVTIDGINVDLSDFSPLTGDLISGGGSGFGWAIGGDHITITTSPGNLPG